jgi:hypothetical protein
MNRRYEEAEEYGVREVSVGNRYINRCSIRKWYFAKFELQDRKKAGNQAMKICEKENYYVILTNKMHTFQINVLYQFFRSSICFELLVFITRNIILHIQFLWYFCAEITIKSYMHYLTEKN